MSYLRKLVSLGKTSIRFPNSVGIAGSVFTSGKSVNIPHAYADLSSLIQALTNKRVYFTQSILGMPVRNKTGKIIGVTQVLNKRGGTFNREDEARLEAFGLKYLSALRMPNYLTMFRT